MFATEMSDEATKRRSDEAIICGREPRLCGREVLAEFSPGRSWLAKDASGRRVVLKRLDEDCLLRGRLHPEVRFRLDRVRELAHRSVANLHGVDRDGERVMLVWEYVEGAPLEDVAARLGREELNALARELVLSVQGMHALGIVHGEIHGRNVIVQPEGGVRLTHVSPLLYTEPAADLEALTELLVHVARCAGEAGVDLLAATELHPPDLDALRARLSGRRENVAGVVRARREHHELAGLRRRAWLGAAVTAILAGLLVAGSIWLFSAADEGQPPQAPVRAME